jgi:predicted ABC-type ATPase
MRPTMIVVAGPPGGGKSTAFPVSGFGVGSFNADDRAAVLNHGSYVGISTQIRQQVNREYERFVIDCIQRRQSFAIETTLRSPSRSKPGSRRRRGSQSKCAIWRLRVSNCIWTGNGTRRCRRTQTDELWIYDNSKLGGPPRLVMEAKAGRVIFLEEPPPAWLARVFGWA